MKESASIEFSVSRWTALEARHVKMMPYRFKVLRPSLIYQGPKTSIPEYVKGGVDVMRYSGRSDIFYTSLSPRTLRHMTHFAIRYATAERPFIIKKNRAC